MWHQRYQICFWDQFPINDYIYWIVYIVRSALLLSTGRQTTPPVQTSVSFFRNTRIFQFCKAPNRRRERKFKPYTRTQSNSRRSRDALCYLMHFSFLHVPNDCERCVQKHCLRKSKIYPKLLLMFNLNRFICGYVKTQYFISVCFCSRILVGAPLGRNLQPGTNHSGALYKCPINLKAPNDRDCIQIETDGRRSMYLA